MEKENQIKISPSLDLKKREISLGKGWVMDTTVANRVRVCVAIAVKC